jgi:HlyD family secretion protein
MRKFLVWILILAVIGGGIGGFLWFRGRGQAETTQEILRSAQVVRDDLEVNVAASGNVAVKQQTDILLAASGEVTSILVEPNERVKADQALALLDTDRLERAVERARIALEQAQLDLDVELEPVDQDELEAAELELASAARALEVARIGRETARIDANAGLVQAQRQREQAYIRLRDEGGEQAEEGYADAQAQERIAQLNADLLTQQAESQWQAAHTRYQQAQRSLELLESDDDDDSVRQLEIALEQAQLRLDQAERNLENAKMTAPYNGVVSRVYIEESTQQQAGQRAFTLIDDSAYFVDVTIDEIDIGAVAVGQPTEITLDAYPNVVLEGEVNKVAPGSTNLGGLVAYQVRIELANTTDLRILDGMTASVSIRTETIEDVLLVPNWAVRADQETGQTYVYRVQDGEPLRTEVEIGRRNDTFTEITSGLTEDTTIGLVTEERSPLPSGPPSQ